MRENGDAIARLESQRQQRIGAAQRPALEFAIAPLPPVIFDCDRIAVATHRDADQVGEAANVEMRAQHAEPQPVTACPDESTPAGTLNVSSVSLLISLEEIFS